MKTLCQNRRVFRFKYRPLLSLLIIFALAACGTVNITYDSTIRAPDDFSISLEIKATDMFAEMLRDEGSTEGDIFKLNDYEGWEMAIIEDEADSYGIQLSQDFTGTTAQNFLAENREILKIDETTLDDVIEYRIEVPFVTDFASEMDLGNEDPNDATNDFFGEDFDESMMAMMDHMITMDITIQVFGDVIESNSDRTIVPSENGTNMHQLRWHYSLSDLSEAKENPFAITTVEIKKGMFGSCNIF